MTHTSRAAATFESSIEDASVLLDSALQQPQEKADVLKRAGLVMALTAWETYVEDRILEAVQSRLRALNGSPVGTFVMSKLQEELKRFHNPSSEKTRRIFLEYLEVDVTSAWKWQNFEPLTARKTLDDLVSKRGDAVHRSRPSSENGNPGHLVKREELEKAIRFLKGLVSATEKALIEQ
ncbi:HEPN domain-containing protein [uncultured Ramlibacter sp.]|uniref:HEPN domain-containing protein n=1 Tax=uncultured Ramlibacter sp. TaxID=260755 RepID=UPI002618D9B1|nr:HEPN domain-containing protein [uncultured Ramlibacter sp.]